MPIGVVKNYGPVQPFAWAGGARAVAGTAVYQSADETCDTAVTPGTHKPLGWLDQDVEVGGIASVVMAGTGLMIIAIASAAIAINAHVTVAASGRMVTTTTVGHYVWGVCRKASSNAGEYIMVQAVDDHVITA